MPCYFFNHGGCKDSDTACNFAHVEVPADEKAKMEKPARRESRSPPPPPNPRQGRPSGPATPGDTKMNFCQFHLKGNCKKGDNCVFTHASQEEAERVKKAKAAAKTAAKAKAKAAPNSGGTGVAIAASCLGCR